MEGFPRLVGVVHLPPLPGSPRWAGASLAAIGERARADAQRLVAAGFDGLIVENFGDAPFFADRVPPLTLTAMTRVIGMLPPSAGVWLGVNVLRNDAQGALAVAAACGADFIRINVHIGAAVTDQGVITGAAAATVRERAALAPAVRLFADVDVKHAAPLGARFDLAEAAEETAYRGLADALIVTGAGTGKATSEATLATVRAAVADRPLYVGSGVTVATVARTLALADGVIVGTALKEGGATTAPVDPRRAEAFVRAAGGP
jgi:hypothetical protein